MTFRPTGRAVLRPPLTFREVQLRFSNASCTNKRGKMLERKKVGGSSGPARLYFFLAERSPIRVPLRSYSVASFYLPNIQVELSLIVEVDVTTLSGQSAFW